MKQKIISIAQGIARMPAWRLKEPIDFELLADEHIAIVGPNGSGKSMLVDMLTGRHPLLGKTVAYDFAPNRQERISDNIKYLTFRDSYGGDNDRYYYLQQRWNQQEIGEDTPTAGSVLEESYLIAGEDTPERRLLQQHLYALFHLDALLDKYIILLSSGELRKLQLTKALLAHPRVLIMDNPFIGLDAETRDQLKALLTTLSRGKTLQVILVLSKTDDIPEFISHVVEVKDLSVGPKISRQAYLTNRQKPLPGTALSPEKAALILQLPARDTDFHSNVVVQMSNLSIRYGRRTILKDLTWTVKNGEHWALSGPNGAGKSTLISLVCADNPQAYACDITLFGIPRGSGESIWSIKKHIGYVSPEMHRAYQRDLPAIKIVASGLKDSVGLYVKPTTEELEKCRFWMHLFGLDDLEEQTFLKLSSGEQRLVLLARAFVKDPELLILDEPLHGLDDHNRQLVKEIINTFCQRRNKTLLMVTHYTEELPACIDHHFHLQRH